MQSNDTRPFCACGCGGRAKTGARFITGSHLTSRFTTEERFWLNVERIEGDACWKWLGLPDDKGYGRFMVDGRKIRAHQFSWMLHFGPIPDGLEVCHTCDDRLCPKPAHLFVGTHHENMLDAAAKDRMSHGGPKNPARGERAPTAKLRDTDIPVIRALSAEGISTRQISLRYGVAHHQIRRILNGTGWVHIK
jgi:hypothetical protein